MQGREFVRYLGRSILAGAAASILVVGASVPLIARYLDDHTPTMVVDPGYRIKYDGITFHNRTSQYLILIKDHIRHAKEECGYAKGLTADLYLEDVGIGDGSGLSGYVTSRGPQVHVDNLGIAVGAARAARSSEDFSRLYSLLTGDKIFSAICVVPYMTGQSDPGKVGQYIDEIRAKTHSFAGKITPVVVDGNDCTVGCMEGLPELTAPRAPKDST